MFHTIIIAGSLGRNPEMRYTPSGHPVTNFSVATNRVYNGADGQVKETIWFRVTAWGKLAEVTNQYLKKGSKVLIEGRLNGDENGNPRIWTDKEGGPRTSFEMTAATVKFLSSNGGAAEEPAETQEEEISF